MKIAYVTVGAGGHALSSLPMIRELVKRGVEVCYFAPPSFKKEVELSGARHIPFPEVTERYSLSYMGKEDFLAVIPLIFLGHAKEAIETVMAGMEAEQPDVIIADDFALAGRLAAWKLKLPLIMMFTSYAPGENFSIFRTFPDYPGSKARAAAAEMAETFYQEYGGKLLTPREIFEGKGDFNICTLTRRFQPDGEHFKDDFFFAGAQIAPRAGDGNWKAPDNGKPLLYSSFGTFFNNWPQFYQILFPVVRDLDINVLCSIGKTIAIEDLGAIPENVTVMPFVPQLEVLSKADYFITHAGIASAMEAMYYGVSCLCIPQMDEQMLTAKRLKELGVASDVLCKQDVNEQSLSEALKELIHNPVYRNNARIFAEEMHSEGGCERAAEAVIAFMNKSAQ